MKKYRMVAVLFTAIVLMLSFTTVAYAASSGETSDGTTGNVTESVVQTPDTSSTAPIPAGTGTVIDSSTDGGGKEFLTIMTPDKNVFYLIIDRDQTSNNVYFLDAVTEKDLLALAEKSGDTSDSESSVSNAKPEKASETTSEPQAETSANPAPAQKQNNNTGMLIVVLAIVLVGGGAGYYFKIYRPKHQQAESEEEDDYSADDEIDLHDAKDTEQADDLPPWEDEEDNAGDSEDGKE
jgi:hypothetical protein